MNSNVTFISPFPTAARIPSTRIVIIDLTIYNSIITQKSWEPMRLRKTTEEMQETEVILIAQVSDALAHPVRVNILRYIMRCNAENTTVCNKNVVEFFHYSQATISQHIKKLLQADLIQMKKVDSFSFYYVNIGMVKKYIDAVNKFHL